MATIPKFHRVELFLSNCWTQLGSSSDKKRRVNPNNETIGKPIAINNSIKKKRVITLQSRLAGKSGESSFFEYMSLLPNSFSSLLLEQDLE